MSDKEKKAALSEEKATKKEKKANAADSGKSKKEKDKKSDFDKGIEVAKVSVPALTALLNCRLV